MRGPLAGKVALVTGSSRGIGAGIARTFSEAGATVVINYVQRKEEAEALAAALSRPEQPAIALKADVSRRDEVAAMVEDILDRFGQIDILVNNAGVSADGPLLELDYDAWRRVMAVHVDGTFHCIQLVGRAMRERGQGAILNISASTAIKGRANGASFCAAKAAIIALTKCAALELAPTIRVNCLCPGFVPTDDIVARFGLRDPQQAEALRRSIPLQRLGTLEDMGKAARFLVSDDAAYVTGHLLFANGGLFMY